MVLTEKGFKRPTYDELLTLQINRARQLFGDDIDTSGESVLGKYLRINVHDLAECYELLEDIYYARFPHSARGQSLDRLCAFAGIVRDPAIAARIKVRLHGNTGAIIPTAFLIAGAERVYYLEEDTVIGSDGTAEAYIRCTEPGLDGNISSNTDLVIVNPNPDLASVVYIETDIYGQERESDKALRIRFDKSVSGAGSATIDAIRGAISRVSLVDGVAIMENDTEQTVDGRPPHSFECYVLAPESQDQLIAEAIFSRKPLGIKSVGGVEISVLDEGGKPHVIRFSRTVQKDIYIRIKIKTNQFFESDGVPQIKGSLAEYINNLTNGDTVYLSSLYGYIHDIHGVVTVESLLISGDNKSYKAENIPVSDFEVARIKTDDIEIEVVV